MVQSLMPLLLRAGVSAGARPSQPRFDAESRGLRREARDITELQRRQPQTSDTCDTAPRRYQDGTINEQSRVTAGRTAPSQALAGTQALVDRLNAGEPYAVAFGGQGGAWLENLEELVSSAGIESELSEIVGEAALLLEPVARELVV